MTQNTQNPAGGNPEHPKYLTGLLKSRLNALLIPDDADPYATTATLASQAAMLDCAFRHLASLGMSFSDAYVPYIHAALKAQNQYRYTVKALEAQVAQNAAPPDDKIKTGQTD